MPNYFDLSCSHVGVLPSIHLTYDGVDDFGCGVIIEEDEDISDEGYRVLLGAASAGDIDYTINDACDKFFDEIDIITADINEIDRQIEDLMTAFAADPTFMTDEAFDNEMRGLRWRKMIKEETKHALEEDVDKILGRDKYDDDFEWPF